MFNKLDADNDGDITEAEFIKVCLEDESLFANLGTKQAFSETEKQEEFKAEINTLPRFSMAAERRITTKRRYSDICTKKNLLYNKQICYSLDIKVDKEKIEALNYYSFTVYLLYI